MAKYAKLSEAMTWSNGNGLFHPNCRHSVSIFIPGLTKIPPQRTPEELEAERDEYKKSQKINYTNRQIQTWKNRVATAITPEEAIKSKAFLKGWYARRKELTTGVKAPIKTVVAKAKGGTFKEVLTNFENDIRSNTLETAIILDYKGNVILDKRGSKSQVSFTREEAKSMKGNILTHNHPGGSSFSGADVNMLTSETVNEIRAVGTEYNYNLINNSGKSLSYLDAGEIENKYQEIKKDLQPKYVKKVRNGLNPDEAWKEHSHELITKLSKLYGLDYKRTIVK